MTYTWVLCWLVLHNSEKLDWMDSRIEMQLVGHVVEDRGNNIKVDFSKALSKLGTNFVHNPPVQIVNENSCLYIKDLVE